MAISFDRSVALARGVWQGRAPSDAAGFDGRATINDAEAQSIGTALMATSGSDRPSAMAAAQKLIANPGNFATNSAAAAFKRSVTVAAAPVPVAASTPPPLDPVAAVVAGGITGIVGLATEALGDAVAISGGVGLVVGGAALGAGLFWSISWLAIAGGIVGGIGLLALIIGLIIRGTGKATEHAAGDLVREGLGGS